MFCKKCGTEIDDGSRFCPKCGAMVSDEQPLQNNRVGNTEPKMKKDMSDVKDVFDEKRKAFKLLPKRTQLIIMAVVAVCGLFIIVAIVKSLTTDPIIGTWVEDWTFIDGVHSEDDPSYLTDRDPYKFTFYKDGSFRVSGGYSWEETEIGRWENITTEADEYPQYTLTVDGDSARFFKGTKDSLSWLVKGYGHEVIVFKRK